MARRTVLTERQRALLFDLPTDEAELHRHFTLSEADLAHVRRRRRAGNRFGFALQLCALRYPGRLLQPGEVIPEPVLTFVGTQLGLPVDAMLDYGTREATRYQHSAALQRIYGYRPFEGRNRQEIVDWLGPAAEAARTNDALATTMLEEMRRRRIIVPGTTTVERLCAGALVAADRRVAARIVGRLDPGQRTRLLALLSEMVEHGVSRFVWLRAAETGGNSADANRLLDRLAFLLALEIPRDAMAGVPAHRIARLRRQGERYYADGMRDLPLERKLAILAVCAVEWRAVLTDAVIETHLRITGRIYRAAERQCAERANGDRRAVGTTLKGLAEIGHALIAANRSSADLEAAVAEAGGWDRFAVLVADATQLSATMAADPLDLVVSGHAQMRRYTPRLLDLLDLRTLPAAASLLEAIEALRALNAARDTGLPDEVPIAFARPKWRKRLRRPDQPCRKLWETAVLFSLSDAFRSGDIWLEESRRFRSVGADLVPASAVTPSPLGLPGTAGPWLATRRAALGDAFDRFANPAVVHDGNLLIETPACSTPPGAEDIVLRLYRRLPPVRITDILLETDAAVGFTQAFTDLRTGAPCRDRIGLMTAILADGLNLGLKKMAAATTTHSFWELLRIARWHIEEEGYARALAMLVEAQAALPLARLWGNGTTASSDGQFFAAGAMGEAMNLVNARYGNTPGIKAYTHVSDRFGPFASRAIPATAHEAPFILDGLLGSKAGREVREHYADTGGFTDHVFGLSALLGIAFAPRIRDLPSKRLYAFDPGTAPEELRPVIGGRIKTELIEAAWPDILRLVASVAAGAVAPSQILRKLAAFPRQNTLALALREVGRIERTLFMLQWSGDADLRRRAQAGLNKGEAHHALKRALSIGRRGEIRDRSSEGQHYRIAGMNLLAAIIIHWNTKALGTVVADLTDAGQPVAPDLLAHLSPLGWEHINLTGEYRWPSLG